jgi:hypothetical protein
MKSFIFWDITPCSPLKSTDVSRNMLPPSSGSKNKLSKKPVWKQVASLLSCLAHSLTLKMEATCSSESRWKATFMLVSCSTYFFNSEDECDMFLWNIRLLSMDYTALHPRTQNSWNELCLQSSDKTHNELYLMVINKGYLDSKGFWWWCTTLRITRILASVQHPVF